LYAGNVSVNGQLSVSSSATVNGDTNINGNLVVNGSSHTLSLTGKGGGKLVLANNLNDNSVYIEGFSSSGNGSASALFITGAWTTNLPNLYLRANQTNINGNLAVGGVLTPFGGLSAGSVSESALASGTRKFVINVIVGDGIQTVTTGVKACVRLPSFQFTITGWEIVSIDNTSGSITFDVRVNTLSGTPSSSGSICGSNKPVMTSAVRASGNTNGWTLPIPADRWMTINVDSASGVKLVVLSLICTN